MTLRPASRSLSRCDGLGTGYNTDVRIGTSSDQASETGTIDVVIQPSRKGQRNIVAEADHDPLVFSVELSGAWSGLRTRTEALGRIWIAWASSCARAIASAVSPARKRRKAAHWSGLVRRERGDWYQESENEQRRKGASWALRVGDRRGQPIRRSCWVDHRTEVRADARPPALSGGERSGTSTNATEEARNRRADDGYPRAFRGACFPRSLHAVADLGVADALDDQPRTPADLAAAVGAHPDSLARVLRLLSACGIFELDGDKVPLPGIETSAIRPPSLDAGVRQDVRPRYELERVY